MSWRAPLVVATLSGRSVEECRSQAEVATAEGADWAEVRLDRWSEQATLRLPELFPAPLPLLATLRSRAEGGDGPDVPESREASLLHAFSLPFAAIDLEIRRDLCLKVGEAGSPRSERPPQVVFSAHLPEGTPTDELRRLFEEPLPFEGIRKLVLPASVSRAVIDLLPFIEGLPEPRPALLTTGPSGALFRVWAARLAMPIVFGSLPEPAHGESVERSQVPVRLLRRVYSATNSQPLCGLLGSPVDESLSPAVFERWFSTVGAEAAYVTLDLKDARVLGVVLGALSARGFRGVNLTHPLKVAGGQLVATVGEEALRSGCANLVRFAPGGWRTENTDVRAIRRRLGELEGPRGRPFGTVLIFGAGGAARATLAALREPKRAVALLSRSASRTTEMARVLGSGIDGATRPSYELVVNATPCGRAGVEPMPRDWLAHIGSDSVVLDWVYRPAASALEEYCVEKGATYEDGSRLLLYQAVESFREWFGRALTPAEERLGWEAICAA
ncbi:MAG: type I 3-dehydroquinate dehydratase [Thermoplasmata archaeon]|nr:type I 3-dehydroquinate dehydratase [Thermoplasmata archaeon]